MLIFALTTLTQQVTRIVAMAAMLRFAAAIVHQEALAPRTKVEEPKVAKVAMLARDEY